MTLQKELTKYRKKTLKELCAIAMIPYLKDKEEYDVNKHYELEWIQMALRTLCNLYENVDAPLGANMKISIILLGSI